jgi:hypothetical protein
MSSFYGLAWTAVKRVDRRYLLRELGPIELDGVRVIAMDEFAIRYATVVVEPYCKRVLLLGLARGRQDIRPFFELLGEQPCTHAQSNSPSTGASITSGKNLLQKNHTETYCSAGDSQEQSAEPATAGDVHAIGAKENGVDEAEHAEIPCWTKRSH